MIRLLILLGLVNWTVALVSYSSANKNETKRRQQLVSNKIRLFKVIREGLPF